MGGFCELFRYPALEDMEFKARLKLKGHAFLFVPKASVIHPWRILGPEIKHFKIQLFSHRLIFGLHPQMKPSYLRSLYGHSRASVKELLFEGSRMQFRGLGKWFLRKLTNFILIQSFLISPVRLPPKG